jgi:tRNA (uracil-5-)-methyltransferase TRM9
MNSFQKKRSSTSPKILLFGFWGRQGGGQLLRSRYNDNMQPETITYLLELNRQFYQTFAGSFAATRRRLQPGVLRALQHIPPQGCWLDLGCGSGTLAAEWVRQRRTGMYCGVDFSAALLEEARQALQAAAPLPAGLEMRFTVADLGDPRWTKPYAGQVWDGILSFAVLHHIPGADQRLRLLREVRSLLPEGAQFIFSVWQFQHSPRLMARVLPWETVGHSANEMDEGDTLLDWRQSQPGEPGQPGLRYVHLFSPVELAQLAAESGFEMVDTFYSDGKEKNLALYQVWKAV